MCKNTVTSCSGAEALLVWVQMHLTGKEFLNGESFSIAKFAKTY